MLVLYLLVLSAMQHLINDTTLHFLLLINNLHDDIGKNMYIISVPCNVIYLTLLISNKRSVNMI